MMRTNEALELKVESYDLAEPVSIRVYLKTLLKTLLEEDEGFSGKRPFGNSGWKYDLYKPLIKAGIVKGTLDEYGDVEEVDTEYAEKVLQLLVGSL